MLFNIYSTDHILKNMLLKPKKISWWEFFISALLRTSKCGGAGRVEAGLMLD